MLAQSALFHLHQLQDISVRACRHVALEKHEVLHVIRGGDGLWHFLCGRGHRHNHIDGVAVPLKELIKRDVSLNAVAALEPHDFAERPTADQPWTMGDQLALEIPECIEEHGWFIALINDESSTPTTYFAYSIGMNETLKHPELIMFGMSPDQMPSLINELGSRIKRGESLQEGQDLDGVIAGARCRLQPMHQTWYRHFLGYSLWYYGSINFPVMQVLWTDSEGRYPGDPDCDPAVARAQPDLSLPKQ